MPLCCFFVLCCQLSTNKRNSCFFWRTKVHTDCCFGMKGIWHAFIVFHIYSGLQSPCTERLSILMAKWWLLMLLRLLSYWNCNKTCFIKYFNEMRTQFQDFVGSFHDSKMRCIHIVLGYHICQRQRLLERNFGHMVYINGPWHTYSKDEN